VFPFDRPLPPGEGDNQALAVNTEDGSVHYDVSFSLVWADGDTATNRNEAYALASCTDCRTVAVAFQVVLVLGSVDVVVPENLSAAVNYACVQCVTEALATQLVVSVPGPLDEQATRDLAAIWDQLRAFGDQIEGVPLSELRARLTGFEEQILAVVQRGAEQAPPAATATPAGTTAGTSAVTAGPTGAGEPATGAAEPSAPTSAGPATGTEARSEPATPTTAPAEESGTPATATVAATG
jgi:putative peptide zinc metalloprotease protein